MCSFPGGDLIPCERKKACPAAGVAKNERFPFLHDFEVKDTVSTAEGDRTHILALPLRNSMSRQVAWSP